MTVDVVRSGLLDVPHGFLGRRGGVSTGAVASLNCGLGSGDDADAVETNRRLAADAVLPGAPLASVHQVHSPTAIIVTEAAPHDRRPKADALVTDRPGLLLGVVTADCAPVLLADRQAGVVGAAHAGWRGATEGVTDQAVAAMISLGARVERIAAAVGPCIARASYEVDHDFAERLVNDDPANDRFFGEGPAGNPTSISRPISSPGSPPRASAGSRRWGSTPMRSRIATSAIAAPATATNLLMDGSSV